MKHIFFAICFCCFSTVFAQNFSGQISISTVDIASEENAQIEYYTNGSLGRMDFQTSGDKGSNQYQIYFDNNQSKAWLAAGTVYYDISAQILAATPIQATYSRMTGNSQQFLGVNCQELQLGAADGTWHIFFSDQLSLQAGDLPSMLANRGFIEAIRQFGQQGIPVLVEFKAKDGTIKLRQEIIQITNSPMNAQGLSLPSTLQPAQVNGGN